MGSGNHFSWNGRLHSWLLLIYEFYIKIIVYFNLTDWILGIEIEKFDDNIISYYFK